MMRKKLLLSYLLIVLLNSTFLSENEDLENKCFDIFLKKRDENDYDFVKIKNAHICVNIDLYDQLKLLIQIFYFSIKQGKYVLTTLF